MSSLFFLLYLYIKKRPCYPISNWITKAEYSVVPLCIIIPVTRYNLLTLSKPNSFSCNVKTTSRLTIDFSGMLPGDITKYLLPPLTSLRLSVFRLSFVICPVQCISLYLTKVLLLFLENCNTFFVYIIRFYQSVFVHFRWPVSVSSGQTNSPLYQWKQRHHIYLPYSECFSVHNRGILCPASL